MAPTLEQQDACFGDLVTDLKDLGEGSKIAICLLQNKGQVRRGPSSAQQGLDPEDLGKIPQDVLIQPIHLRDCINGLKLVDNCPSIRKALRFAIFKLNDALDPVVID